MSNAASDITQIAEFQRQQVLHSRNDADTARLDWCEANLNHVGWIGTRVVIEDHAGVSETAATFRRAIDVAMERAPFKLGDVSSIAGHATAPAAPAIDLTALRYEALIDLVTGKHAQQFLTEMCWDGSAPSRKQLEGKLDKMIKAAR
ncbi:hypothetical protein [Collimonas sp.]|jgi:hypothetical protein|uniref:hypothetical protein n=1 Tax=Collimonas sp. TaxID=1963772 RepID=UPI002D155EC2|nr:hypothetical protein [Collimonas sp.]HWW07745.1 hypothetical protein [Collimonas sp.]